MPDTPETSTVATDDVVIAQKPCGCKLTDKGRDIRCAEHKVKTFDATKRIHKFADELYNTGYLVRSDELRKMANECDKEIERLQGVITRLREVTYGDVPLDKFYTDVMDVMRDA